MYEIRLDGKTLWYPGDMEATLINPELDEALSDAGYVQFTVPVTNPLYNDIKERISMVEVYKNGNLKFNAEVREISVNSYKEKKVYAVGELAFLYDSIQPQRRYQDISVVDFFESLLNEHNSQVEKKKQFTPGIVTVTDSNDSLYRYTNYDDTLTALREKLCDSLDGYLRIRHVGDTRYLDLITLGDFNQNLTQTIQFGENLMEYASTSTANDIATACIPLGSMLDESEIEGLDAYTTIESVNDGKNYVYSEEAVKQFGWIYKVVNWDDVTVPENLLKKAKAWLAENQFASLTLELKAIDMSIMDVDVESLEVGDKIRAIAEPFGMDTWFPLQQKVTYFQNPENNKLTLSNTITQTYTAQVSSTSNEIKSDIPQTETVVQSANKNTASLIRTATNGHIALIMDEGGNPAELLIMDSKDRNLAKNVWKWDTEGLSYSDTGYDGTYKSILCMNGNMDDVTLSDNAITQADRIIRTSETLTLVDVQLKALGQPGLPDTDNEDEDEDKEG